MFEVSRICLSIVTPSPALEGFEKRGPNKVKGYETRDGI